MIIKTQATDHNKSKDEDSRPPNDSLNSCKFQIPTAIKNEANKFLGEEDDEIDYGKKLVESMIYKHNQHGQVLVLTKIGDRKEATNIATQSGEDVLANEYRSISGSHPPKSVLDKMKSMIRHSARCSGETVQQYQRVAKDGHTLYIDLGDEKGQVIEIVNGRWELNEKCECLFNRPRGYKALAYPKRAKSAASAILILTRFLKKHGIEAQKIPLVIAVMVCWVREGVSYPILSLYGPAGCGKSTVMLLLAKLVDPPATDILPTTKYTTEDIAAFAQARHLLTFDNASRLSGEIQDMLCVCSTGGVIMVRMLYTNGDVAELPIHRPIGMTSVSPVITRADALTRTVSCQLNVREDRKTKAEILAEFDEEKAELFGALLELVAVSTIPYEGELKINHRLYEFVEIGQRMCIAAGIDPMEFMTRLDNMRKSTGAEIAEGDDFVSAIRDTLMIKSNNAEAAEKLPGYKQWWSQGATAVRMENGTVIVGYRPKQLLQNVRVGHVLYSENWLPKNTRQLNDALLRATPVFSDIGIQVHKSNYGKDRIFWQFTWLPEDDD